MIGRRRIPSLTRSVTAALLLALVPLAPHAVAKPPVFDRVPLPAGATSPENVAISADGNTVVFDAYFDATAGIAGAHQVFAYSRRTKKTTLVSVACCGAAVAGDQESLLPTVDGTGRHVAFQSYATNLVAGDTNGASDVFVRDLVTGRTTRASVHPNGSQVQGSNPGQTPRIDAAGHFLFFLSWGDLGGTASSAPFLYRADLGSKAVQRVSLKDGGGQPDPGGHDASNARAYAVSADGRFAVFRSTSALTADAHIGRENLYWRDMNTGAVRRLRKPDTQYDQPEEVSAHDGSWITSTQVDLDASGRYVAATVPSADAGNASPSAPATLIVIDTVTGSTTPADAGSAAPVPAQADPSFGFGATILVFSGGPVAGGGPAVRGLYSLNRRTGELTGLTTPASCLGATCEIGTSTSPAVSTAGPIAFLSDVPFSADDTDASVDVYIRS